MLRVHKEREAEEAEQEKEAAGLSRPLSIGIKGVVLFTRYAYLAVLCV